MSSIKQYSVLIKLKYNIERETCVWQPIVGYSHTQDKFVIYSPVFASTTSRGSNDEEFNDGSIGHSLKHMHTDIRDIRVAYCAHGFSIEWSINWWARPRAVCRKNPNIINP